MRKTNFRPDDVPSICFWHLVNPLLVLFVSSSAFVSSFVSSFWFLFFDSFSLFSFLVFLTLSSIFTLFVFLILLLSFLFTSCLFLGCMCLFLLLIFYFLLSVSCSLQCYPLLKYWLLLFFLIPFLLFPFSFSCFFPLPLHFLPLPLCPFRYVLLQQDPPPQKTLKPDFVFADAGLSEFHRNDTLLETIAFCCRAQTKFRKILFVKVQKHDFMNIDT